MIKSIVLTGLYPESESNMRVFQEAVDEMRQYGITSFEHFSDADLLERKGEFLKSRGLDSVYLGAIAQKRNTSSLCNPSQALRKEAVDLARQMIDQAVKAQASKLLLTSGWYPDSAGDEKAAFDALYISMCELLHYAENELALLLEPGDRHVEFMQLIGPTQKAAEFAARFKGYLQLVVDTSHLAQLCEEPKKAIVCAKPYCAHIHLANCILDKSNSLYGDKHPLFGVEKGVFSQAEMHALYLWLQEEYLDAKLTVGLEIINRGGPDFVKTVIAETPWFFQEGLW